MTTHYNYPLLSHNTFGIDARCREFSEYASIDELRSLLPRLRGEEKWLQIGGGSNLLFTNDFDGLVLHAAILGKEVVAEEADGSVLLRVGAGENWDALVAHCVTQGYHGAENLSLIPGEVGASAVQNIGAYGVEVGQLIDRVEALCIRTGEVCIFSKEACEYAYRSSVFKHALKGRYIVTHVVYRLSRQFRPDLEYGALRRALEERAIAPAALTASQLREVIIGVRRAKLPDPSELGSAGSFFMNPIVPHAQYEALVKDHPSMPHYDLPNGDVKVPAAWMIEQCGWKGRNLGRAGVYPKQALVLVNLGGATGQDIVALSQAIQKDVKNKFGIDIHPEANFIS